MACHGSAPLTNTTDAYQLNRSRTADKGRWREGGGTGPRGSEGRKAADEGEGGEAGKSAGGATTRMDGGPGPTVRAGGGTVATRGGTLARTGSNWYVKCAMCQASPG